MQHENETQGGYLLTRRRRARQRHGLRTRVRRESGPQAPSTLHEALSPFAHAFKRVEACTWKARPTGEHAVGCFKRVLLRLGATSLAGASKAWLMNPVFVVCARVQRTRG